MKFTPINMDAVKDMDKVLARAEAQTLSEAPKFPACPNNGVAQMNIVGRFANERARLGPEFTEVDRQWRIKWHQDQALHHGEPLDVAGARKANLNIFRRIYQFPLNAFEDFLATRMSRPAAIVGRKIVGRGIMGYCGLLVLWYNINYNLASWEQSRGMRVHHTREVVLPGDKRYPMPNPRTESWQHYDRGFHERKVFRD